MRAIEEESGARSFGQAASGSAAGARDRPAVMRTLSNSAGKRKRKRTGINPLAFAIDQKMPVLSSSSLSVSSDAVENGLASRLLFTVGDGSQRSVAAGDASYRRRGETTWQAAAYGSATGVASYRARREAMRSGSASGIYGRIGRLQAAAVDVVLAEVRHERIVARRARTKARGASK